MVYVEPRCYGFHSCKKYFLKVGAKYTFVSIVCLLSDRSLILILKYVDDLLFAS